MKKWISYMLLSSLLVTALPVSPVRAAETSCTGKLAADGNNINVSLSFPQAASENITSLQKRWNPAEGFETLGEGRRRAGLRPNTS